MDTFIIILVVINILLGALAAGLLILLLVRSKYSGGGIDPQVVNREGAQTRETITSALTASSSAIFAGVRENIAPLITILNDVSKRNSEQVEKLQAEVRTVLGDIRADNEKQLTELRNVVDEKLQSTLSERFNQAFAVISQRLEAVAKQMGEMQVLTNNVTDLNKMLSHVKTRGAWGEVELQSILQDMLHETQYEAQVSVKKNKEKVDFVIKLPGNDDGERVLLPIDCKFPVDAYVALQEATERVDVAGVELAKKGLFERIKAQAKDIADKYIDPPHTTNFAIIYFPTEGLYSEVVQNYALVQELQSKYRVLPAGPTNITALVSSLQLGFRTVQIQKKTLEIVNAFVVVRKEISSFAGLLDKVEKQLATVSGTVADATRKTRTIEKKMSKIELPEDTTAAIGEGGLDNE